VNLLWSEFVDLNADLMIDLSQTLYKGGLLIHEILSCCPEARLQICVSFGKDRFGNILSVGFEVDKQPSQDVAMGACNSILAAEAEDCVSGRFDFVMGWNSAVLTGQRLKRSIKLLDDIDEVIDLFIDVGGGLHGRLKREKAKVLLVLISGLAHLELDRKPSDRGCNKRCNGSYRRANQRLPSVQRCRTANGPNDNSRSNGQSCGQQNEDIAFWHDFSPPIRRVA